MAAAVAILSVGLPATRANLVVNGSFEADIAPPASFIAGATPSGWTLLGTGGLVDVISAGYGGASVASDGAQFLDLIGGGVGTLPSGVRQSLSLTGGQTYEFSFNYTGDYSSRLLDYSISGILSGSFDVTSFNVYPVLGAATPWQTYQTSFVAPATASYTIEFKTASGSFESPFIDNVSLTPISVPETASTLLLLALAAVPMLTRVEVKR